MTTNLPNPGFETNLEGYTSLFADLARVTTEYHSGFASMRVATSSAGNGFASVPIGATGGRTRTASVWAKGAGAVRLAIGSGGTILATSAPLTLDGSWQQLALEHVLPASASDVFLQVKQEEAGARTFYVDDLDLAEEAVPTVPRLKVGTDSRIQVETAPGSWTTLGKRHVFHVNRSDSDPGTIEVEILDSAVDPTTSDTLRLGRAVRLQVVDGAGGWQSIYTGTVDNIEVDYDPRPGSRTPVSVQLTAVDNVARLANQIEHRGVGTIDELRWIVSGVPFVINGSSAPLATGTIVATNENASLWDQILITRDSNLGYAWIDMENQLRVYDAAQMDTTIKAELTPAVYSDVDIDFTLEQVINTVTVNWRRYDIGTETATDVPYGPYVDQPSVDEWGTRSASFTVQGATEVEADIVAFANEVLTRNATPEVRPRQVTIPIRTVEDLALVRGVDVNSRVSVTYSNGLVKTMRVVRVVHDVDHNGRRARWNMVLDLALPSGVTAPSQTPGTGVPNVPPGSIGEDDLDPDVVQSITDAMAQALAALAAANEAADFAESKNAVYRQPGMPTEPAQGPFRKGDIWFDTDDGNRIYVHDGTNFVDAMGSYLMTPNGKLMVTPNGLYCFDASNNLTLAVDSGTGSIVMAGSLNAGLDINGATVTGGTVQSSALVNRGIKFDDSHFIAYDSSGNPTVAIDAATGAATFLGDILSGSTITSAVLDNPGVYVDYEMMRVLGGIGGGYIDLDADGAAFNNPGITFRTIWRGVGDRSSLDPPERYAATMSIDTDGTLRIGGFTAPVPHMEIESAIESPVGFIGKIQIPSISTSGAAANAYIDTEGHLLKSTASSRRFKKNIRDADLNPETVLALVPRAFKYRNEYHPGDEEFIGFIAEEADELGLGNFVDREKGQVENFAYARFVAAQQVVLRDQAATIRDLVARVEALEATTVKKAGGR